MDILVKYALTFVGIPYIFGGYEPMTGFDCSGFVQELLKSAGEYLPQDFTAQGIYDYYTKNGKASLGRCGAGALVFFGDNVNKITHVAMCLDNYRMIEAGHGDSSVKTLTDAIAKGAYIRVRAIANRKDKVAILKPWYAAIGQAMSP